MWMPARLVWIPAQGRREVLSAPPSQAFIMMCFNIWQGLHALLHPFPRTLQLSSLLTRPIADRDLSRFISQQNKSGQMPRNEAGTKQSCQQTDDLCSNFELRIGNGQLALNLCST